MEGFDRQKESGPTKLKEWIKDTLGEGSRCYQVDYLNSIIQKISNCVV